MQFCTSFVHGLKMCMWFGFNPAVNFCHFSTLLTLSFFVGATSISPTFDLYFHLSLQFSTLKFFVTLFSGTVRSRRLKFGTHLDSGQVYHVYQNQDAAAYSSLYFFFLSNF